MSSDPIGELNLSAIAVLIPVRHIEPVLEETIAELMACGFALVVLVDDGSPQKDRPIFNRFARAGLPVLRHSVNLGKGRALKTGFNYILTEYPHLLGVVTADADGQHTVADIAHVAARLAVSGSEPILGVRSFSGNVPLRSRFGNTLTRVLFAFGTGVRVGDTQTGLRGLPMASLPELMTLDGERYEYEMTMLAHLCREGNKPVEVPIETVYIEGNRSSHFDPVWDSMRIYFVLARFFLSSILASGIDFLGFTVAFALTHHLAASVAFGRFSSLVNFALNRRFVFRNRGSVTVALLRYYALVILIAFLSYALIWVTVQRLHWNVFVAKLCVDAALSLMSFSVQRTFIFRRSTAV
ncbi:bifunctional glycosyltransferase family 2/GtrA family protein [Terriglobus saanensis]|uniref:Glycosyl transferase family 2 n=1 Tax=Terriglobus saanensis (strain ATCC BAA-1853 / DSM 23119 / SP1PR4) TaxID=401053 RepID=E8UZK3_TERSS|nr:bifunctional glycosyltransferase family 2/GtrA family protein [Terriglobus saanensis]ADV84346.1 glycosyl transferase family 2 [Terriglobus saanensis SP1PR4]